MPGRAGALCVSSVAWVLLSSLSQAVTGRASGKDAGVTHLILSLDLICSQHFASHPTTLGPAGQEVLAPMGDTSMRNTAEPHWSGSWDCHLAPWAPHSSDNRQGVTVLFGVTDPDSREEIELQAHRVGQEESVWNTGASLGQLRTPRAVIKVSGNQDSPGQPGLWMADATQEERFRSPPR